MANGYYPYPYPVVAPAPAPSPPDKKGNRQKGNKKDKKGQTPPSLRLRQGHLTPTSLVPLCLALLNCTSIATSMAGRPLTSGHLAMEDIMAMRASL